MFAVTVTAHADITVAMREQITEEEGPVDANRDLYQGLQQHDNPWSQNRAPMGDFGPTKGGCKLGDREAPPLLFARLLGLSTKRPLRRYGLGQADAKGRRGLCHPR